MECYSHLPSGTLFPQDFDLALALKQQEAAVGDRVQKVKEKCQATPDDFAQLEEVGLHWTRTCLIITCGGGEEMPIYDTFSGCYTIMTLWRFSWKGTVAFMIGSLFCGQDVVKQQIEHAGNKVCICVRCDGRSLRQWKRRTMTVQWS